MKRAQYLGWPNTYTLTKSLAESLLAKLGTGLPIAIVRPAIVESSTAQPFRGWNEGINTSASLSYLLGTYFRQLPTNERKRLDVIPVDAVCRGMTLTAAAILDRRHDPAVAQNDGGAVMLTKSRCGVLETGKVQSAMPTEDKHRGGDSANAPGRRASDSAVHQSSPSRIPPPCAPSY